ncbi:hypothetical protein [Serinicoccus chungangensis]|nr:hypothetical protein [Serinicoccus chungangensis]
MGMTEVLDLSPARWLLEDLAPWDRLVGFGPSGFEAYARLRLIPDPEHPDQSESARGASKEGSDLSALRKLLNQLVPHTTTPGHGYFCFWDGYTGAVEDMDVDCPPVRRSVMVGAPLVRVPHREYYLFEGPLEAIHEWGAGELLPAFVWPEDRAWCTAADVDQHWVGVGASEPALQGLLASLDLDVVRADPTEPQPFYLR